MSEIYPSAIEKINSSSLTDGEEDIARKALESSNFCTAALIRRASSKISYPGDQTALRVLMVASEDGMDARVVCEGDCPGVSLRLGSDRNIEQCLKPQTPAKQ